MESYFKSCLIPSSSERVGCKEHLKSSKNTQSEICCDNGGERSHNCALLMDFLPPNELNLKTMMEQMGK